MKTLGRAAVLFALVACASAVAEEAAIVEAGKFLDTQNWQAATDEANVVVLGALLVQNPQLAPYKHVMQEFIAEQTKYDVLKPELAALYATAYSASELNELSAFFSTPTGRKYVLSLPGLMSRAAAIGSERAERNRPELDRMLRAEIKRIRIAKEGARTDVPVP